MSKSVPELFLFFNVKFLSISCTHKHEFEVATVDISRLTLVDHLHHRSLDPSQPIMTQHDPCLPFLSGGSKHVFTKTQVATPSNHPTFLHLHSSVIDTENCCIKFETWLKPPGQLHEAALQSPETEPFCCKNMQICKYLVRPWIKLLPQVP